MTKAKGNDRQQNALESVASILKNARVRAGLSMEEVAELTKVSLQFIEAVEKGDRNELPERAFTIGYIRTLANLYDLHEEGFLTWLRQSFPEHPMKVSAYWRSSERAQLEKKNQKRKNKPGVLAHVPILSLLKPGVLYSITAVLLGSVVSFGIYYKPWKYAAPLKEKTYRLFGLGGEEVKATQPVQEKGFVIVAQNEQVIRVNVDGKGWIQQPLSKGKNKLEFQKQLILQVNKANEIQIINAGRDYGKLSMKAEKKQVWFHKSLNM